MSRVGFEPTVSVFEWAKTVHALDRAATVIGCLAFCGFKITSTIPAPLVRHTGYATQRRSLV
jgi:hypothetical protein